MAILKKSKIVVTVVVGDLFHIGHKRILEKMKKLGGKLIVGVVSDLTCAKYKRLPIIPQEQRKEMIEALRCVDKVEIVDSKTAKPLCEKYKADIFARAYDWQDPEARDYIISTGGKVKYFPLTEGISSTKIIEEIINRYKLQQWK